MQKQHWMGEESEGEREREVEERARWRGQERKVTSSEERRPWTNASAIRQRGLWQQPCIGPSVQPAPWTGCRAGCMVETLGLMRNNGGGTVPACVCPRCDRLPSCCAALLLYTKRWLLP